MHYLRKSLYTLLLLVTLPVPLWAAGAEQTLNTLPQSNASFITNLQTFLKREDAQRYALQFAGFVVSGGTHATVGSLTAAPDALVAFPGGHYVTEVGSITYANNETTWAIAHKDLTGNLDNFVRVAGTHYLIDATSASKPSLPSDSVWLMEVTTSGGSITAVTDLRTRVPAIGTYLFAELPAVGLRGRLAFVRDVGSGTLYMDTGAAWTQVVSNNPMTAAADMIVGGASGAPTRLPKGTADQVLGMNAAATAQEYKTITAGSGISVVQGVGTVTIAQSGVSPAGVVQAYMGTAAPTGWLLCDGTAYDADTYPDLFLVAIPNAGAWGRGPPVGSFTVNDGTDTVTLAGHGLADGSRVHLLSTVTLPGGLDPNTQYFVINGTTDTLQLALTAGGAIIDLTDTGTGTHTLYDKFQVPDLRARVPVGVGAASHDFTISAVDTGTDQLTIESNTALYTGDTVVYDTDGGAIGGLVDATTYYVIRLSANTVQLATTEALAVAGTDINLTSAGSGVQVLRQTLTTRTTGSYGGTENIAGGTHKHGITDPGHNHTSNAQDGSADGSPPNVVNNIQDSTNVTVTINNANTTGITITNSNAQGAGSNMTPFLAITYIVKH